MLRAHATPGQPPKHNHGTLWYPRFAQIPQAPGDGLLELLELVAGIGLALSSARPIFGVGYIFETMTIRRSFGPGSSVVKSCGLVVGF
jgi:hypothetical protein